MRCAAASVLYFREKRNEPYWGSWSWAQLCKNSESRNRLCYSITVAANRKASCPCCSLLQLLDLRLLDKDTHHSANKTMKNEITVSKTMLCNAENLLHGREKEKIALLLYNVLEKYFSKLFFISGKRRASAWSQRINLVLCRIIFFGELICWLVSADSCTLWRKAVLAGWTFSFSWTQDPLKIIIIATSTLNRFFYTHTRP